MCARATHASRHVQPAPLALPVAWLRSTVARTMRPHTPKCARSIAVCSRASGCTLVTVTERRSAGPCACTCGHTEDSMAWLTSEHRDPLPQHVHHAPAPVGQDSKHRSVTNFVSANIVHIAIRLDVHTRATAWSCTGALLASCTRLVLVPSTGHAAVVSAWASAAGGRPHREALNPGGALQLGARPQLLQHAGHLSELRTHGRHVAAGCSSRFTGGSSASVPVLALPVRLTSMRVRPDGPITAALMCSGFTGIAKYPAS